MSRRYLIDANVFIEAKNRYYAFDRVPRFWQWCLDGHERDLLFSVAKVRAELTDRGDELSAWVKQAPRSFFIEPDDLTLAALAELSEWANSHDQYRGFAKVEFLASADLFLIAHASAHGFTVVSQESSAPNSITSIKLPDACNLNHVECVQVWQWLDDLRPKF